MKRLDTMGERMTDAREALGLSRPQLAKACGLTRAAVKQWEESSVKGIRPVNLLRVCEVLGVEVRWLVTGEGRRHLPKSSTDQRLALRWSAIPELLDEEEMRTLLSLFEATIAAKRAGLLPHARDEAPALIGKSRGDDGADPLP